MIDFEPRFITFDCYGTMTNFRMGAVTRELVTDLVPTDRMDAFVDDLEAQRLDEVLGPYKPYPEVVNQSFRTTLELGNLEYREADGPALVDAVPTWGPHPNAPDALRRSPRGTRWSSCPTPPRTRSDPTWRSWGRRSTPCTPLSRRTSAAPARTLLRAAISSRLEHDEGESR